LKILFAAPENAWGGFLGVVKAKLPDHRFRTTGGCCVGSLTGVDMRIPPFDTQMTPNQRLDAT
jgi:hypothetical protein